MNEGKIYAGADWLVKQPEIKKVSVFGQTVADILGQAYAGLYHLDNSALHHKRTDWSNEQRIEIVVHGALTFRKLSVLVAVSNSKNVQLEISGAANDYIRLRFFNLA